MSEDGLNELLRLYVLLRGTADPRTRWAIREDIDAILDRAQGFMPGRLAGNGHDRSSAS